MSDENFSSDLIKSLLLILSHLWWRKQFFFVPLKNLSSPFKYIFSSILAGKKSPFILNLDETNALEPSVFQYQEAQFYLAWLKFTPLLSVQKKSCFRENFPFFFPFQVWRTSHGERFLGDRKPTVWSSLIFRIQGKKLYILEKRIKYFSKSLFNLK